MNDSRLTTGTNTADVLRALADHTDNHHLNLAHANLSIMPRYGRADVLLHTSDRSAINAMIQWARSIGATHIHIHNGDTGYHLGINGHIGSTPIEIRTITRNAETASLSAANTRGRIALDELADHAKGE